MLELFCFLQEFHTSFITSLLVSLSNIPSQPIKIKSYYFFILKDLITGSAISTLGLPPFSLNLAVISPKLRLTDNLPGKIL
jgi:hypothetical protein